MRKLCFFNLNACSVFCPEAKIPIGGTEVQLFNLASYLSRGYEVTFIVSDHGQCPLEKHGEIRVYKSTSLDKKLLNYLQAPFLIWKSLKRADADIYIASSAAAEIGIIALFCKIHGKRFVYRTASSIDCDGTYEKTSGIRGWLFGYGLRRASVVVQNVEHQQLLLRQGISSLVIRNGFFLKENAKREKKIIFWVGRIEPNKRPDLFLRVIRRFPGELFRMIAPKQVHQKRLFEEIEKEAVSLPNIDFIESVPFYEIQKYFDEAKIFVGTSDYEGFPNTYIQACIGKTPIVSYKVNPDEFITKNNLGYCAEGNFEKMIGYIEKLLKDERDWKEKSENSFRYVTENHDVEIIGKQWMKLLQKLESPVSKRALY